MAPLRVQCSNCEDAKLIEYEEGGELMGYICESASESERESRGGCGAVVSAKEYKQLKAEAEAKAGKSKNSSTTAAHTPARTTAAPLSASKPLGGLGGRRPLSSLHGNALHSRTPLHASKLASKPASSTPPSSSSAAAAATAADATLPASAASSVPAAASTAVKPASKPIAPPAAASTAADDAGHSDSTGDDTDDSDDDDGDGEGGEEDGDSSSSPGSKSASSTPTKVPSAVAATTSAAKAKPKAKGGKGKAGSSSSSSSTSGGAFNLADPSVSAAERLRALKRKLAAQKAARAAAFAAAYGADGDEDTAEEKANAARKVSGQASEDFLTSSQGGDVVINRAPLLDSLSVKGAENLFAEPHRKPWTAPRAHGTMNSGARDLMAARAKAQFVVGRRLGARARAFGGTFGGYKVLESPEPPPEPEMQAPPPPVVVAKSEEKKVDGYEPLTIWVPTPEELAANPQLRTIEVPHLVCHWLRPHQREGVKFMCECVLGQRNLGGPPQQPQPQVLKPVEGEGEKEGEGEGEVKPAAPVPPPVTVHQGAGAILADDMGLGKTLQSVGLVYTLLTQGFEVGHPIARKVIIVTPTSLVANWRNEIDKWLGKGVLNVVALSEVGKDNIECGMDDFTRHNSKAHVLIISYDTFRRYVDRLNKPGMCDLLICDEAHRLKNNKTATYTALDSLPCKRRVLLSGTPMQNDLSEFFSMINFTNRRILGDRKAFRKYYELPILMGREPECFQSDAEMGAERSAELSAIVNQFVLRRTNVLLKKHLPPKVIQVVCCRPSALQIQLYQHFLASKSVRKLTSGDDEGGSSRGGGGLQALPLITSLKKLVNHPKLIYDSSQAASNAKGKGGLSFRDEETGTVEKVPPALVAMFKSTRPIFEKADGGGFMRNPSAACYSGKMYVLERLLLQVRASTTDRMVIVSNFTSALDVIATMCTMRKWDYLRLDGTTSIKKRQQLVDQLSDHRGNRVFVFLLSSRAGGCGLNLVGANRLILFDPDWNPAVDKQAAARVWRDGQNKRCFVYRFLTTGTIEEKIYQRQLSKEGLSGVLGGSTADASLTKEELRDLFQLDSKALEQPSDTHLSLNCECLDSYAIRTEEEAARVDAQQQADAEKHAKAVAEEEARRRAEEGAGANGDGDQAKDNGASAELQPGAPAASEQIEGAPSATTGAEGETGAQGEEDGEGGDEGGGEGEGEGGQGASDDDDDADGDEEMNDFVVEDSDDDGEDYGSKKKSSKKSAAKKPSKKEGPRKQRKKRSTIGSLNYPQLHALSTPTLGQRGEPPEEELINWAHHATSNSIPDPWFRTATKNMPLGPNKLPYVSFVFSCEIAGKAIVGTSDADDALAVSARCEEAPVVVQTSKPAVISPAEALAKHADFMREYTRKQKKQAGVDSDEDMPDLVAHPELRRHSTRVPKPILKKDEPDAPEEDADFTMSDGGGSVGRKRKQAQHIASAQLHPDALNSSDMDEASREAIAKLLSEDSGLVRKRGGGGRQKKVPKTPSPRKGKKNNKAAQEEEAMSDIDEEGEEEASNLAPPPASKVKSKQTQDGLDVGTTSSDDGEDDNSTDVQEISPIKKRKIAPAGSVASPARSKASSRASSRASSPARKSPALKAKSAPAPPPPAASASAADDDDDFLESPSAAAVDASGSDNDSVEVVAYKVGPSIKRTTDGPAHRRPMASLQPRTNP